MFRGDRSEHVALGLAILLLIAAWSALIWQIASQRQYYADTAQQQAERTATNAQAEFQDCLAHSARIDVLECIEGVAEAKRAAQRAEYDLAAQQEMAYWTPWMMLGSVLAATAAIIGVAYIAATLKETRRGAQAAIDAVAVTREIGEAQVRGYLLVKSVTANINDRGQLEIAVEVENTGLSPLLGVQVYCLIRLVTPEKEQVLISDFGDTGRRLTVVKRMHLRPSMPQDYVRTFDLKGVENSWLNADDRCTAVVEVDLITLAGDVFGRNIYGHEGWGLNDEIRGAHAQMRLKNVYATSIDELDRFEWYGIQIGQMWPLAVDQHR